MALEIRQRIAAHLELEEIVVTADETRLAISWQEDRDFGPQRLARMHVGQDASIVEDAFQQDLDLPARRLCTLHPGRNHAGVIEYEQIACAQQAGQIEEPQVMKMTGAVEPQQAAARALRRRPLSDQFFRKVVGKVAAPHGARTVSGKPRGEHRANTAKGPEVKQGASPPRHVGITPAHLHV